MRQFLVAVAICCLAVASMSGAVVAQCQNGVCTIQPVSAYGTFPDDRVIQTVHHVPLIRHVQVQPQVKPVNESGPPTLFVKREPPTLFVNQSREPSVVISSAAIQPVVIHRQPVPCSSGLRCGPLVPVPDQRFCQPRTVGLQRNFGLTFHHNRVCRF